LHARRYDVHARCEDGVTRVTYFRIAGMDHLASCSSDVTPERSDRSIDGSHTTAVDRNVAASVSVVTGGMDDGAASMDVVAAGDDRRRSSHEARGRRHVGPCSG
jgi:hypothetical protein